jgi:hypothetical protein
VSSQDAHDGADQTRVLSVEEPIDLSASPRHHRLPPRVECREQAPKRRAREPRSMAALHQRDRLLRQSRASTQLALRQSRTKP